MGAAAPASAQRMMRRSAGQLSRSSLRRRGSPTSGRSRRSVCSAASRTWAASRSTLTRLDGGVLGEDRLQAPAAELRRLLGQEIDALALQRREDEPEIRAQALGDGLALDGEPRAALGERLDLGQPFAVAAVEEQDRGALLPPQHIAQVMAARRIQRDRRTGRQRRIHIETRNHPVGFRPSIHPDPTQPRFRLARFNWLSIARRS